MLGCYFLSWVFTLLLTVLVTQTAIACTLFTPSIAEGITNDQQFQTSVVNCTPPYVIQFWDRNNSNVLTYYNGTATVVYFTIHNGVGVDVYFVLTGGLSNRAQSIDYIVKANPNEASISLASVASMVTSESIWSVSILSGASITSLQALSSLSIQSELSVQSVLSLSPTTIPSTYSSPTPSSPFPSETSSSSSTTTTTTISGAGPTNPSSQGNQKSNSNVGAIVGGVVGGLLGAAIIAVLVTWLLRRKSRESVLEYPTQPPSSTPPGLMAQTNPFPLSYPVQNTSAGGTSYNDPRNYYEGGSNNPFGYSTGGPGAGVAPEVYRPREEEASEYPSFGPYEYVPVPGSDSGTHASFSVPMRIERIAQRPSV